MNLPLHDLQSKQVLIDEVDEYDSRLIYHDAETHTTIPELLAGSQDIQPDVTIKVGPGKPQRVPKVGKAKAKLKYKLPDPNGSDNDGTCVFTKTAIST